MKKHQVAIGLAVLLVLALLVILSRGRNHFDFGVFRSQLALADWRKIALGLGCIYVGYFIRSARWAFFLRHQKRVAPFTLLGTQVIGFTAVALIGRVADLVRPYLVARKTRLELSSQIAVYIVERLFDFGAMGLIFSVAMLGVPQPELMRAISHSGHLMTLSQHAPGAAAFAARYGGLVLTLVGAFFLVGIRMNGEIIAASFERVLGLFSKKLGTTAGHKIRTFHTGLDTIRSFSDFAVTASLSLVMWILIASSYYLTMHAFTASPELANVTVSKAVLLMLVSGAASTLQLPVIGWFSQIGVVMLALITVLGAGHEAAMACAAMLLVVTFLGIMPIGLIWAQFENISLRRITIESEQAGGVVDESRALD